MSDLFNLLIDGRDIKGSDQRIELLAKMFSCGSMAMKDRVCGKVVRIRSYSDKCRAESALEDLFQEGISAKIAPGAKHQIDKYLTDKYGSASPEDEDRKEQENNHDLQHEPPNKETAKSGVLQIEAGTQTEDLDSESLGRNLSATLGNENGKPTPIENEVGDIIARWRKARAGIFIALGLTVLSIFVSFSSGYNFRVGFFGSIPYMNLYLVDKKTVYVDKYGNEYEGDDARIDSLAYHNTTEKKYAGYYIPLKYGIVFGISLIGLGIAIRMSSGKDNP